MNTEVVGSLKLPELARLSELAATNMPLEAWEVNDQLLRHGFKRDAWATLKALEAKGLVTSERVGRGIREQFSAVPQVRREKPAAKE